jgi:hypothetical protein
MPANRFDAIASLALAAAVGLVVGYAFLSSLPV